ncbi:uncharacterized protein (DUF1501 family) [Actinoplanes tereljensis]|uniref:DUF1501 domain-containing protein n=1 Tax=Paractinoplanes tereljensis TaxID=571912 RepID=A0A919NW85_9ACTN|nr:DUF1501 domain-containing protein [Actinoplanes tereljensis]GIF25868.1 hypothetical protein Ate02nite_85980 [Actinoplanes tereljensis]
MKFPGCVENATISRRTLLGAAALTGLAGAGLSTQLAFADPTYSGDTLVVLSLHGGFDGLSAIAPIGDPDYYKARPTIALPKSQVIAGDGTFGLHPALNPLLPLWKGGKLAAVHAVGQPNPTRSHFAAMDAMENAAPGTSIRGGWLDRMLGVTGATGPLAGVSVGGAMPSRLFAGPVPAVSMAAIDKFTLAGDSVQRPMAAALKTMYADAPPAQAGPALAAGRALTATAAMRATPYTPANGAAYPATELGGALRDVARLIKSRTGLVTAAVDCGDWDMHDALGTATKGQRMYDNLTDLALALAAFSTDLGPAGMNSVTLLTISEFGRRVQENASHGADHGHGNAMLLLGGGVRGGKVYTAWPGLSPGALVAGDLAATTDYRSVIGELLQKRCRFGSLSEVFPGVKPSAFGLAAART